MRLPALAKEVVLLKPDVIFANAVDAVVALRKETRTIPIVSPALADAVHLGLIAREARPAGNVTGIEPYVAGLPAKQMELAREIVPHASNVGLLTNLQDGFMAFEYSISGKWLELLTQVAPTVKRAAVLRDSTTTTGIGQFGVIQALAANEVLE